MNKFIIYTPAYNAEKTLRRAVDSVLSQTYTNFVYYLLDNAATDGTYEIIKEYAERDKRIIPLHNEKNWGGNGILDVIKNHSADCYLCELDADDEYASDFLEKMFIFIEEYQLDIAVCCSDFINALTNRRIGVRKLEQSLILHGDGFDRYFPAYHQFMRTIWGKAYSISILRRPEYKKHVRSGYGNDTLFAMNAFHNANRIGILAASLHKYYVSQNSVSYQFDKNRAASDRILFDAAYDFLISKCDNVSSDNLNALFIIYLNAIRDTVNVLLNAQISVSDKLANLFDIFQSRHTQELIKWSGAESEKSQLFSQVVSWMLSKEEVRSGSGLDIAADILALIDIYPSQVENCQCSWLFMLLVKIRNRRIEMSLSSRVDQHIASVAYTSQYLVGLDAGFLCYFCDIVFSILQNDEKKALNQIEELIEKETEIPDTYVKDFLALALNLSAKLEYPDCFVYFKKLQISLLIDLSRIDEAMEEFADWDKVLPDDMDFKKLKERLGI